MEEDIKEIIKVFKGLEFETYEWDVYYDGKLQINCDTMNTYLENILNELERLQKENELLESTKDTCPEMATSGFRCHLKNALNFEKTVHTCLHCGNDTPLYCEKCYQELISKNAELQLENEELKQDNSKQWEERCKLSFEVDDSIPKQKIRDKIEEVNKEYKKYTEKWEKSGMNKEHPFYRYIVRLEAQIDILEELLGDVKKQDYLSTYQQAVSDNNGRWEDKIRDKIQLLEKELKLLDKNDKHTLIENDYIISVLKEILGE